MMAALNVEGAVYMLSVERHQSGHVERAVVTRTSKGWDFREEHDDRVVRERTFTDWHRVERAMQLFERRNDEADGYSTNR